MRNLKNLTIAALLSTSINFALGSEFDHSSGFDPFEGIPKNTALKISYNRVKDSTSGKGLVLKQKLIEANLFEVMGGDPDKEIDLFGLSVGDLKDKRALDLAIGSLSSGSTSYFSGLISPHFISLDEREKQSLRSQIDTLRDTLPPLHQRDQFGRRVRDGSSNPIALPGQFMYDVSQIDFDKVTSFPELQELAAKINSRREPVTTSRYEFDRLKRVRNDAIEAAVQLQIDLEEESLPHISDLINMSGGILTETDAIGETKAASITSLFSKMMSEYQRVRMPESFLNELLRLSKGNVERGDLGQIIDPPFPNIMAIIQVLAAEIEKVGSRADQFMSERDRAVENLKAVSSGDNAALIRSKDARIEDLSAELTRLKISMMSSGDVDASNGATFVDDVAHESASVHVMSEAEARSAFKAGTMTKQQLRDMGY